MGIRDLWNTLAPFCERKPLYTLEGQAIAIDLSCWVVEAQTAVADYALHGQHLRNVFYRTTQLLTLNVYPVFVLEGKAPTLKYKTIAERNLLQNKNANTNTNTKTTKAPATKDRTRFHHVLKQCAEMLKFMGLTCVTGKGEAEAMCAYLNSKQLVSGVISQDSDCFAYGARVVYRNYSKADNKIDVYDMVKAENALSFGRNKIIVIALFCGSDYNSGVNGVGRDAILNFLYDFKDNEIINRIKSWRTNPDFYNEWDKKIRDKKDKTFDEKFRSRMKNELQIRSKALKDPKFPNEELINEFLVYKDDIEELDLTWRQPHLISLLKFTSKLLGWKEIYTFQKVLPLMTYWQLKNHKLVAEKIANNKLSDLKGIIFPKYIKDRKTLKGVPSYELVWEDKHNYFDGLIPEEQIDGTIDSLWTTIEKADLIEEAHPTLIEAFEEEIRNKKIEKRKNQRQNQRPNAKLKKPRKKADAICASEAPKTLDSFFPKTKVSKLKAEAKQKKHEFSFDLNCSGFTDDDDDASANISLVVDRIVSKPPKFLADIEKMALKCAIPSESRETKNASLTENDYNDLILETNLEFMREKHQLNVSSSFFAPIRDDDGDETINYDADELEILNEINQINGTRSGNDDNVDDLNDTFDEPYIPLLERLKKTC